MAMYGLVWPCIPHVALHGPVCTICLLWNCIASQLLPQGGRDPLIFVICHFSVVTIRARKEGVIFLMMLSLSQNWETSGG